MVSNFMYGSIG